MGLERRAFKGMRLRAPVFKVQIGDKSSPRGKTLLYVHELVVPLDKWETPKQHRVHNCEHCDIQSDGEREHRDRCQTKCLIAAQCPQRQSQIVKESLQHWHSTPLSPFTIRPQKRCFTLLAKTPAFAYAPASHELQPLAFRLLVRSDCMLGHFAVHFSLRCWDPLR